jgi:hypothetical protein
MNAFMRTCSWVAAGSLAVLALGGCNYTFKQPAAEAPHAAVIVTYLGGEVNPSTRWVEFGYQPGVTVCEGRKPGKKCKKAVDGNFEQGKRDLAFRIPADQEVTISPFGIISSSYSNNGVTTTRSMTYCLGEDYTVTAKAGDKLHYFYAYDPAKKACGTKRADELPAPAP